MIEVNHTPTERFGFSVKKGGAHSSRTIMLEELGKLLAFITKSDAKKDEYLKAIDEENCLGKRSQKTRILSYRHLVDLYSLDSSTTIFRVLLYFWKRDEASRPLLAMLCAYSRDPILRSTAKYILKLPGGQTVPRFAIEELIDAIEPGRFSKVTLTSTAQNINASWTKSGHLLGRNRKVRSKATASVGSVAYALFLGYLKGCRGSALFKTEYVELLDCSFERALELAEDASRNGWLVSKRVGNVIEVLFPDLITAQELEWTREQN